MWVQRLWVPQPLRNVPAHGLRAHLQVLRKLSTQNGSVPSVLLFQFPIRKGLNLNNPREISGSKQQNIPPNEMRGVCYRLIQGRRNAAARAENQATVAAAQEISISALAARIQTEVITVDILVGMVNKGKLTCQVNGNMVYLWYYLISQLQKPAGTPYSAFPSTSDTTGHRSSKFDQRQLGTPGSWTRYIRKRQMAGKETPTVTPSKILGNATSLIKIRRTPATDFIFESDALEDHGYTDELSHALEVSFETHRPQGAPIRFVQRGSSLDSLPALMKTAVKHMSSGNREVFQKAWLERLIDPAVASGATIPRPTKRKVPEVGEEPASNKVKPVVIVLDDSDTDSDRPLASLPAPAPPSPMPHAIPIPSTLSHTHTPIGNDLVKLNDRQLPQHFTNK
ncbi:hypothetical protein B0H14DRAFT_2583007 [Mycena olivaceomarginata]|nr:hypothetical protein B0H14DRAFT_2583007 [Mycena olivaceomarginata]